MTPVSREEYKAASVRYRDWWLEAAATAQSYRAERDQLRAAAEVFVAEWDDLMRGQDATIGESNPDPRIEDRWTSGIKWRADVWARFVSRRDALSAALTPVEQEEKP